MAGVADYPINFPYGATSSPYSAAHPHRGDDRAAPQGTPVIVDGTTIGLVGATGLATGPHLHLQEWQGSFGNVRKPQNSFKGGKVVAATSTSDFGNYVTIQTADGWNDTYAHLSRINVSVGQVIGGSDNMITRRLLEIAMGMAWGGTPSAADYANWVGKNELDNMLVQFEQDQRRKNYYDSVQKGFACLKSPTTPGFTPVTEQLYKKT